MARRGGGGSDLQVAIFTATLLSRPQVSPTNLKIRDSHLMTVPNFSGLMVRWDRPPGRDLLRHTSIETTGLSHYRTNPEGGCMAYVTLSGYGYQGDTLTQGVALGYYMLPLRGNYFYPSTNRENPHIFEISPCKINNLTHFAERPFIPEK